MTNSRMFSFTIELRDAGLFLIDQSSKRVVAPMHEHKKLQPRQDLDFEPVRFFFSRIFCTKNEIGSSASWVLEKNWSNSYCLTTSCFFSIF